MINHWPPPSLTALRRSLDTLGKAVEERREGRTDDEQIWLTRFFVVRICGYLEQVVHETIRGYISAKSGGLVRTFAHSWMDKSRNPSPDNMVGLVGRLDASLGERLTNLLEENDNHLLREISLLVDRRHKIAHGLNEGLTPAKALSLKATMEQIADWFIAELDPNPRKSPSTGPSVQNTP